MHALVFFTATGATFFMNSGTLTIARARALRFDEVDDVTLLEKIHRFTLLLLWRD